MLRRNECRLNFKNRPVRTGDIKGGPKQPPLATNRGSQEPATNRVKPGTGPLRHEYPSSMNWALSIMKWALSILARRFQAYPNLNFYRMLFTSCNASVLRSKMGPQGIMYGGRILPLSPPLAAPLSLTQSAHRIYVCSNFRRPDTTRAPKFITF